MCNQDSKVDVPDTSESARIIREEGNTFYRQGKLVKACEKYQAARKLAPKDGAPLGNLSAALYELGKYEECARLASEALKLLEGEASPARQAQQEKLQQRILRAKSHAYKASANEQRERREQILGILPRYKPSMLVAAEYFTVGHDVVTSLFGTDDLFERMTPEAESVSFFLGGVGDARNALQTMCVIAEKEKLGKIPIRSYHFTLNDIQKSAIARDLIVWMLLDDLSKLDLDSEEAAMILNTVFFIYISTIMPKYTFEQLDATIDRALKVLEAKEQPLKWLHLHKKDMPLYIATLRHWKEKASGIFTPHEIMRKVSLAMLKGATLDDQGTQFCKQEQRLYAQTAILFPSTKVLRRKDPEFLQLLMGYINQPKKQVDQLSNHVKNNWYLNTTLVDKQWNDSIGEEKFDVGFNPHHSIIHFSYDEVSTKPRDPKSLFDHMSPFFIDVAKAVKYLDGRLKVEAILDDYADVAERLHFNLYQDEMNPGEAYRPKHFPVLFDRIHLSNVPDYMHGHLSTFLYAFHILRRSLGANVRANCLRNSDSFPTVLDYLSEYQVITSQKMLQELCDVMVLVGENKNYAYPMADYTIYAWSNPNPKRQYSGLLERRQFTKWFYGLFFRLALPFQQNLEQFTRIIWSPLNMSILFRLIAHLHKIGYPAHWLSEPLLNILSKTVTTSARPPHKKPMRPSDLKTAHPEKKLCTAPFAPELATLASIFQPLLPFSLPSSSVPDVENVYRFTFTFESYGNYNAGLSCLFLLFTDTSLVTDLDA